MLQVYKSNFDNIVSADNNGISFIKSLTTSEFPVLPELVIYHELRLRLRLRDKSRTP